MEVVNDGSVMAISETNVCGVDQSGPGHGDCLY